MACQRCNNHRVAIVTGKTSDRCFIRIANEDRVNQGYPPIDMGIGGGDYISFHYCLECGQIQGKFPLPKTMLEATEEQE